VAANIVRLSAADCEAGDSIEETHCVISVADVGCDIPATREGGVDYIQFAYINENKRAAIFIDMRERSWLI